MKRFVAIEDEENRLLLVGENESHQESGEARESRIKGQYVKAMRHFAASDLIQAYEGLTDVLEELEERKKGKKGWESQLIYLTRRNLAELEESRQAPGKALGHYRAALREDETDVIVWLRAGKCASKLGKLNVARRAFEGGLVAHPNHVLCAKELGKVLIALGEVENDKKQDDAVQLLKERRRAEEEEHKVELMASEESIVVAFEESKWDNLVGAIAKALRLRLKQQRTLSAKAILKCSGISPYDLDLSRSAKSSQNGGTASASEEKGSLSPGIQGSSKKHGSQAEPENRRHRVSERQRKIEQQKEESRRTREMRKIDDQVDVEKFLLQLLTGEKAKEEQQKANDSTVIIIDSPVRNEQEVSSGTEEKKEAAQVRDFILEFEQKGSSDLLDILWQVLVRLSVPKDPGQLEPVRRLWKTMRPHFHHTILPPEQALIVAEALLPSTAFNDDLSGPDGDDDEILKRLYDAEALLGSILLDPVKIFNDKLGSLEGVSHATRAAWVKAEALKLRGRIREASEWYQYCDELLSALGDENAALATLGGYKRNADSEQLRNLVNQRLKLMEGATSLEEAKNMLENSSYDAVIALLSPKVRAAVAKQHFSEPHLLAEVHLLRVASEKSGDDAGTLMCRALELKFSIREVRFQAKRQERKVPDSTTLLTPLKKIAAKVKDLTAFDGGRDAVTKLGPCGWNLFEAVRFSVESLATVASIVTKDLKFLRGRNAQQPGILRQKRLALARAMLGHSRAFWFVLRWGPGESPEGVDEEASRMHASLQLLRAVRFALQQMAECCAVRADGTSGVVIKFYASILRDRLADLEQRDEEVEDSDSHESEVIEMEYDRNDPNIWSRKEYLVEELGYCYQVLYDIPVMKGPGSNWLTKAEAQADDVDNVRGSTAADAHAASEWPVKGGEDTHKDGRGDQGGCVTNPLDPVTCGHILSFYRDEIVYAVQAHRGKNLRKVVDVLSQLSSAMDSHALVERNAMLSVGRIHDLCHLFAVDVSAGREALLKVFPSSWRELLLEWSDGTSGKYSEPSNLYDIKMFKAAALLRVSATEFKRRKEPEKRADILEVLQNQLEGAQEVRDALRVRPWSISAWRRLGCFLRDAANVALDIISSLGKSRCSVDEPLDLLVESVGCFRIELFIAEQLSTPAVVNARKPEETKERMPETMHAVDVDKQDESVVVLESGKRPFIDKNGTSEGSTKKRKLGGSQVEELDVEVVDDQDAPKKATEFSLFMESGCYDLAMALYMLARGKRKQEPGFNTYYQQALAALNEGEELQGSRPPKRAMTTFEDVDYEDFSSLSKLSWYVSYLKGKLLWKNQEYQNALVSYERAAKLQGGTQTESQAKVKKGGAGGQEVEATYRLRASQMKVLLERDTSAEILCKIASSLSLDLDEQIRASVEPLRRKVAAALVEHLERCRSKESQEHGDYFYKSVYYVALAVKDIQNDPVAALEKISSLFRPETGERGYFYLMWNYRFTDMRESSYLESERKHRYWRFKCLQLFMELLTVTHDHDRLWNVLLRGRRRSKDDSFPPNLFLKVISGFAEASVFDREHSIGDNATVCLKRAWDAMEETTRLLHERAGSLSHQEPAFLSVKKLMEMCYAELDVIEEEGDLLQQPYGTFKAAIRFCTRRWATDQRIAKRALAALAEFGKTESIALEADVLVVDGSSSSEEQRRTAGAQNQATAIGDAPNQPTEGVVRSEIENSTIVVDDQTPPAPTEEKTSAKQEELSL